MQMDFRRFRQVSVMALTGALLGLVLAACGPEAEPPVPTRAPAPTFTPTPVTELQPVDPNAVATAQAVAAAQEAAAAEQAPAEQAPAEQPAEGQPAEAAPPDTPEATPTPEPPPAAEAIINSNMNVRGGPGTNYNILGGANQGERYPVTGRSNDGTWWQINYNGQDGWVYGELVTTQNVESVQVAQNIPAPPPTAVPPTPTPVPPPAAPAEPPKPQYKFNITAVSKCAPQEAGTWFEGRTYVGGQPSNGYRVVFSYAPDGPPVTEPMISGPHPGYEGWNTGYYSHIISAAGPRAGNWFVWVVDEQGQRISEIANWQSKGPGGDCNQASVDFDSR
ncbi:MAG: SH3 domain-containing protein [Caldilineaceae bacterium]|nr:SH3 domain-containing protein [Caldilineaceae bacterium]